MSRDPLALAGTTKPNSHSAEERVIGRVTRLSGG